MMKYRYALLILAWAFIPAACSEDSVTGSGRLIEVNYPMENISRVAADDAFSVDITIEDTALVTVLQDDNILGNINVDQDGPTVRLGLDRQGKNLRKILYHAYVSLEFLRGVTLAGGSKANIVHTNTTREPFNCVVNGNSRLNGSINVTDMQLEQSGASTIVLGGEAASARLRVDENSVCDLRDFSVIDCRLTAGGGCTVLLNVTGTLHATVRGNSKVYYSGDPSLGEIVVEEGSEFARK